jgi:hypothetical protein
VTWGSGAGIKAMQAGIPVFHEFEQWIGGPGAARLDGQVEAAIPRTGSCSGPESAGPSGRSRRSDRGRRSTAAQCAAWGFILRRRTTGRGSSAGRWRGCARLGLNAELRSSLSYRGRPEHDVAVFYGLAAGSTGMFRDYRIRAARPSMSTSAIGAGASARGSTAITSSVNSRHPTDYFQRRPHGPERFAQHGVTIRPWRSSGEHILLAGMSAKAAAAEGLLPHMWERETIAYLRELTRRPIVYRPKPNWADAKPLEGSTFDRETAARGRAHQLPRGRDPPQQRRGRRAARRRAVHLPGGVASLLSGHDLEQIENPPMPAGASSGRRISRGPSGRSTRCRSGAALRYLLDEG